MMSDDEQCPWRSGPMHSHLSKDLLTTLIDNSHNSLLEYFIHFMQTIDAVHLVQFWLTVESFKSTPQTPSNLSSFQPSDEQSSSSTVHQCVDRGQQINIVDTEQVHSASTAGPINIERTSMECDDHACRPSLSSLLTTERMEMRSIQQQRELGQDSVSFHCRESCDVELSKGVTNDDVIGIYTRYISLNASQPVGLPSHLRHLVEAQISPENGIISLGCFDEAQEFVFHEMERLYLQFLNSPMICKYQLEYIATGRLQLYDILLNDSTLSYFMEYMDQEGTTTILLFWMAVESFHSSMNKPHSGDTEGDTEAAIAIYTRFISLQATQSLNFNDKVRQDVEDKICREKGPSLLSFSIPQELAYQTMSKQHFPSFLESSLYLKLLNDLLHSLEKSQDLLPTVDKSLKGAEEVTKRESHFSPLSTKALDDPESLWRRRHFLMRLGYVDPYGMYISEVEQLPEHSSKFSLSFFGSRRQDEELSMKIARKIISETVPDHNHYS